MPVGDVGAMAGLRPQVTFAEFSKYLVNNAPPVRPELSIFRSNSGAAY